VIRGKGDTVNSEKFTKYVRAIRNKAKRAYADKYLTWYLAGEHGEPPERPEDLSVMGAQSVRLHIENLARANDTQP